MRLIITIVCLGLIIGCRANENPSRVAVHGSVSVDGQPLAHGSITFIPTGGTFGPKAAGVIDAGHYEIPQAHGPVIGRLKVEVRAEQNPGYPLDDPRELVRHARPILPTNRIPDWYNDDSTLMVETSANGENTFDFSLITN